MVLTQHQLEGFRQLVQAEDRLPGVLLAHDIRTGQDASGVCVCRPDRTIMLSKYTTYILVTLPGVAVLGLFDDLPIGLRAKVTREASCRWHGAVKGRQALLYALNSQWLRG